MYRGKSKVFHAISPEKLERNTIPLSPNLFNLPKNLNKPSPLSCFYLNTQIKTFLKNSQPHHTIIVLLDHRYLSLIRSQIRAFHGSKIKKIPLGGIKKTSVESENYSHAFLSSPSYLRCYLKKINSWSGRGEGDLDLRSTRTISATGIWSRKKKEKKKGKNDRQKLCAQLESSVIFFTQLNSPSF